MGSIARNGILARSKKGAGQINLPPSVDAGVNKVITLPTNSVSVTGTATDNNTIISTLWSQVSGPSTASIVNPILLTTTISNLVAGTYVFQLSATDIIGAVGTDFVTITVNTASNIPPVANAGLNKNITLPTNSVTLTGSGTDSDGVIVSYLWTKVSGPSTFTIVSPTLSTTVINNLVAGTYIFQLLVTDNQGATNAATATVTVNAAPINQPPTSNAGNDQTIQLPTSSVTLTGSGTDGDGSIVGYLWTKISGTGGTITTPTSTTTTVTGLSVGTYVFNLRVTDNGGLTANDTVVITVLAANNIPPIASAGPDQTIQLPTTLILNGSGSDSDGTISTYLWTRVSGPNTPTINTANTAATSVTDLAEGTYVFRMTVTDNNGGTDTDDATITVLPAVPAPTLDAQIAQVSAPTVSITSLTVVTPVTLNLVSNSTSSISIGVYQWSKVSGPACTISNPNSNTTSITNIVAGTYVFRLQIWLITPWESFTDTQDITITVTDPASGTYYVDGINGNDTNNGTSTVTAWKTIARVNTALTNNTILPGNVVRFRCNQTYYGGINIPRSGTIGNPIIFSSWDIGNKPILSGFSSTNWANLGSNLWESTTVSTLSTCNILFNNGLNLPYGRMPKTGYWNMDNASQTNLTASELNSATTNWGGANVAIKTARWHIDRYNVTSHSGSTLTFPPTDGNYIPEPDWGFFLQNHVKACTVQNEWCYNSTTKKVTMYSTTMPTNIKIPTVEIGINLNAFNHITINNLAFEGYNSNGVFANLSDLVSNTGITIQDCKFDFIGKFAIFTNRRKSNGIVITNNIIDECNDGGIHVGSTDDAIISDNIMTNTGNLVGMGQNGDESYSGIVSFAGDNCKVYRNNITNAGYVGIRWDGDGTEIVNNTVINTNYIKDDGGGIYNYPNNGDDTIDTHVKRRLVKGNIVIDAPGNNEGSHPDYQSLEGYCIYNDGNSSDTDFIDNFCYNSAGSTGCFFMNGGYNNIVDNNLFLGSQRVLRSHVVKNITPLAHQYTNNTYVAKESNQYPIYWQIPAIPASWLLSGNRYAKPIDDSSAKMWIDDGVDAKYTLVAYKARPFLSNEDQNATNSVISVANSSKILHFYNETAVGKTIALGAGVYRDAKDGTTKTGNIILQPYTGIVLLNTV
jgi:hypothetical protein